MQLKRILGQNHILTHFENAIKKDKISHAYIINGEEGSGKMQLAVHFAKALQCEQNNDDADDGNMSFDFLQEESDSNEPKHIIGVSCGICKSCRQTDSGNQPDIKYVSHEKAGIGVDEIRAQINEDIGIKPYSSRYKIYIVPDSENMTVQAQNALLKTIEEPPKYAIIILLTTNADTFLPTILSRCVLLNVKPVKEETITNYLKSEYGIGDYEARVAASFANGNPGKAVKLAASEDFKELKQQVSGTLISLEKGGMDIIAGAVKAAGEFKKQNAEYFSLLRIWFRDMLMYKASGNSENLIFQDDYMIIESMSQKFSYYDVDIILKSIEQAERRINSNVNFDATMEVLFLAIKERMRK